MSTDSSIVANDAIRASTVLVISPEGDNLGEFNRLAAISKAGEFDLDLVQVSPSNNGTPPVCKIIDLGKYKYEIKKKQHRKQVRQDTSLKEIRVHLHTAEHDLNIKHKRISDFLIKRHPVKYTMDLKGSERRFIEKAKQQVENNISLFSDVATWDDISVSGRRISTILKPQ